MKVFFGPQLIQHRVSAGFFLFFHFLLLRALADERAFCFSRSSATGTACLLSAAIILSVQDLNTQNLLGKQAICSFEIFIIAQKKSLAKNRMTELKARMEGGARGAGAQSQIIFYRDIFCWFDLAPALLHACICSHHCLNMRMLKYG